MPIRSYQNTILRNKKRTLTIQQVNERLEKKNRNIRFINPDTYINTQHKAEAMCFICGHKWEVTPNNIFNGWDCPVCSKHLRWTNARMDEHITSNKMSLKRLGDVKNSKTYFDCRCLDCDLIYKLTPDSIVDYGKTCPQCSNKMPWTNERIDEYINENITIAKRVSDVHHSEFDIQCNICNHMWKFKSGGLKNGVRCPNCYFSNEKLCKAYLLTHLPNLCKRIDFYNKGYTILGGGVKARIDFKLTTSDNQTIFIEYNGRQHYEPVQFGKISKELALVNFEKQKLRDQLLRDHCASNRIKLFEIDGRKYTGKKIERFILDHIVPYCVIPNHT